MSKKLEYDGIPEINRKRSLSEQYPGDRVFDKIDKNSPEEKTRQDTIDKIYRNLAKTLIKGNALKKALAAMDPAQFIPIEEEAESVRAAARRFDRDQSRNGDIITFEMYQRAIERTLNDNAKLKTKYFRMQVPATSVQSSRELIDEKTQDSEAESFIKAFLQENGIAGTILSMFTLAPFQSIIFQTFTVEQGARSTQAIQIPAGLALFIEFGIKAERLYNFLKKANPNIALSESQVARLENDEVARAEALGAVGIDHEDLKASLAPDDARIIMEYVGEYYTRYGGLVEPGSHLSLDHWIAYLQVAQSQSSLNSALRSAPKFTGVFDEISGGPPQFGQGGGVISEEIRSSKVRPHVDLMSVLRELNGRSNTVFDDIVNAFMHQITDRDLCCLISLFGNIQDRELLRTFAYILRILATDLSGEIIRLDNLIRRYIQRELQEFVFDLTVQLNEFYDKIQTKLIKLFTLDLGTEQCSGLLTLGFALSQSLRAIYKQMQSLIREISQALMDFGEVKPGSWTVAAERRHLLGMAKILEVLANRLDAAAICETQAEPIPDLDFKDRAANEVITNLLEVAPPTPQLTDDDLAKYFPNLQPSRSEQLGFSYGINYNPDEDNQVTGTQNNEQGCSSGSASIESLIEKFKENLNNVFSSS